MRQKIGVIGAGAVGSASLQSTVQCGVALCTQPPLPKHLFQNCCMIFFAGRKEVTEKDSIPWPNLGYGNWGKLEALANLPSIDGEVFVLIDVSGSINSPVTG